MFYLWLKKWNQSLPIYFTQIWFFKLFYFIFTKSGKEGEREGDKHQCVVASHVPPTGDLAHNPGMCPDQESTRSLFGLQARAQSTELYQPGLFFPRFHVLLYNLKLKLGSVHHQWQNSCDKWLNFCSFIFTVREMTWGKRLPGIFDAKYVWCGQGSGRLVECGLFYSHVYASVVLNPGCPVNQIGSFGQHPSQTHPRPV